MNSTYISYTRRYSPSELAKELGYMASERDQNTSQQVESAKTASPPKTETAQKAAKVTEKGEKIKKDLDKIIDEIDDVLEENAEEFIRSYVQRGGE